MAGLDQSSRVASLHTNLADGVLALSAFDAREGLSELFDYRIEAVSEAKDLDPSSFLGEKFLVRYKTYGKRERFFHGIVVEAQRLGFSNGLQSYRFVLKPWLWLLANRADCKIFKNKTAKDIIEEIFKKEPKNNYEPRLSETYQVMDYCVQYRETDLSFVSRIMEQHGIYYYFVHDQNNHKLVLSDSKSSHDTLAVPAERNAGGGSAFPLLPVGTKQVHQSEFLHEWWIDQRLRTGKVVLTDYDYKQSTTDLQTQKEEGADKARKYEVFDYPGKYTDKGDGERFATIRVQSEQAIDGRRLAIGKAMSLVPGALVTLDKHPVGAENSELLVVRASHSLVGQDYRSGVNTPTYNGSYEFLPSDRPFRAPLVTPLPRIYGPQTAKVVGENRSDGEEIDVDEYGCILVQFHWDRASDTTSRRVRTAQVWSGKNWGGQVIPRVGQEVVVVFLEGDPDQPLVVGAVYNDQHKLPYELPGKKTQSGLKSDSSKGGGGYNEIQFEDEKDGEIISVHAQKDLHLTILNSENREIGEDFKGSSQPSRNTVLKNGDDNLKVEEGSLIVEAKKKILLKVGQSSVLIEPTTITIDAPVVEIKTMNTSIKGDAMVQINGGLVKIN